MWKRKKGDERLRGMKSETCLYVCVYLSFCWLLEADAALREENDLVCLRKNKKK